MDGLAVAGLSPVASMLLVMLSLLTSAITAAVGAGGGMLMLGVMASLLPAAVVIPVHGLVQLGSNSGRLWLTRRDVVLRIALAILAGATVGAGMGSLVLLRLPMEILQLSIAVFILLSLWAPLPRPRGTSLTTILLFGATTGFLSLFVGATGPLVAAYNQRLGLNRFQAIATLSACMVGLNLFKLAAFAAVGFDLRVWLPLVLAMTASGFLGTWMGLKLLNVLPEKFFNRILRMVLTLLALNLAYQAFCALAL